MEVLLEGGVNAVLEACIALRCNRGNIWTGNSQAMVMMGFLQIRNTQFHANAAHAIAVPESKGDPFLSFSGNLVIAVEVIDDE
jgi:hypothetical protein